VFDPLAVALIIAFNGLIGVKKKNREEIIGEMVENNQKMGLYEVYGDTKEDLVEPITETEHIEPTPLPYYEEPNFDWNNKNLWINNPSAVKYWMNSGNSINNFKKLYKQHLDELDNTNLTKTY
jgi:hypothetical protein